MGGAETARASSPTGLRVTLRLRLQFQRERVTARRETSRLPSFSDMLNHQRCQTLFTLFVSRRSPGLHITLGVAPRIITEGELMSRCLLSICVCLTLGWLSGCAHCQARRAARACCRACEPCDCAPVGSTGCVEFQPASGLTIPGPIYEGIPGPTGQIPGPIIGAIPGPPRR